MGIFENLGKQGTQRQGREFTPEDMRREIGSISADPCGYLHQRGFNVPEGMSDPRQITQHLLQTGQVSGGRVGQILKMLGVPGMR